MEELIKEVEILSKRIENKLADLALSRATDDFITEAKVIISMEKQMAKTLQLLRSIIMRKENIIDLTELWHSIDVEPQKGSWFVGQIGDSAYDTFIAEIEGKRMKDWLIGCNIKRWAYVEDFLPKGGRQEVTHKK